MQLLHLVVVCIKLFGTQTWTFRYFLFQLYKLRVPMHKMDSLQCDISATEQKSVIFDNGVDSCVLFYICNPLWTAGTHFGSERELMVTILFMMDKSKSTLLLYTMFQEYILPSTQNLAHICITACLPYISVMLILLWCIDHLRSNFLKNILWCYFVEHRTNDLAHQL